MTETEQTTPDLFEVDQIAQPAWERLLGDFSDATIYQTWAYGAARWGADELSHMVLREKDRVIAMAQVRILKPGLVPVGMAYVGFGPIWQLRGEAADPERFRRIVEGLRQEYVERRGLALRIVPNLFEEAGAFVRPLLEEAGFTWTERPARTLVLDLSPSLEELRQGMRRKWRQTLGYAEKGNLQITEASDAAAYGLAVGVYQEMASRKAFAEFVDQNELLAAQSLLPAELKMRVLLCSSQVQEGHPIAALAWAVIGDTGLPMLAATTAEALEKNAAYLLWWRMVESLKNQGYVRCDLGGISPERNPGGYTFKSGLAGKDSKDVRYVGQFEMSGPPLNKAIVAAAEWARQAVRKAQLIIEKVRRRGK